MVPAGSSDDPPPPSFHKALPVWKLLGSTPPLAWMLCGSHLGRNRGEISHVATLPLAWQEEGPCLKLFNVLVQKSSKWLETVIVIPRRQAMMLGIAVIGGSP